MRTTSIEAYAKIKQNGLLSKSRFEVYEILVQNGPLTAGEIFKKSANVLVKGSICARLTELRELGVVKELDTAICDLTGMSAILWEVVDSIPDNSKLKKTKLSNADKIIFLQACIKNAITTMEDNNLHAAATELKTTASIVQS